MAFQIIKTSSSDLVKSKIIALNLELEGLCTGPLSKQSDALNHFLGNIFLLVMEILRYFSSHNENGFLHGIAQIQAAEFAQYLALVFLGAQMRFLQ